MPWWIDAHPVGLVEPAFAARHLHNDPAFRRDDAGFHLVADNTPPARHQVLAAWEQRLLKQTSPPPGWRDERYSIYAPDGRSVLAELERSLFRPLGLISRAVQLNGWQPGTAPPHLWLAQRNYTKAIDPARWDNLTAGGVAHGETLAEALAREAMEEAGIAVTLTRSRHPWCRVLSEHMEETGLHREWVYVFDLELPADWVPLNQDGEVMAFLPVPVAELPDWISK